MSTDFKVTWWQKKIYKNIWQTYLCYLQVLQSCFFFPSVSTRVFYRFVNAHKYCQTQYVRTLFEVSDFISMLESVCQFLPRKDWEECTGTQSLWNSSIVFSFALFFAEDSELVCIFVSFFIRSLFFLGDFKFF